MFYIINQGERIQTPLEKLLRSDKVNPLRASGAISPIGQDQPGKTPAVETLLPANSFVYVGWDGYAAHKVA